MQSTKLSTAERSPGPTAAHLEQNVNAELRPEAWVGAAADYEHEQRYGGWLNMARPDEDIVRDVKTLIRRAPPELGCTWGMFAARGFGYWQPSAANDLRSVARAARNMIELGLPYSALVAAVGPDSLAVRPDRYAHSFVGEFGSRQSFAAQVAADSGWNERLADLPSTMQSFVRIDLDALVAEAERELTIVDKHDGGIWVFDPRVW